MSTSRIVAGLAAVLLVAYALMCLYGLVTGFRRFGFDLIVILLGSYAVVGAILCGWFALRSHVPESRRHLQLTLRAGKIVGGIAFVAGFIGPIIFTPQSNQGPLLGIFLTGPLGFVVGALGGWLYGRRTTAVT